MSHERVLPLLGIARVDDSVAFISPYMPGRSLDVQLSSCSIPDRLRILTEVSGALAFLHQNNIIYGCVGLVSFLFLFFNPTDDFPPSTKSTIVLDPTKKAYLSSFLFAQTDWTEFAKVDSTLYSRRACPVYPLGSEPITWQDDVLAFGTLLTLVRKFCSISAVSSVTQTRYYRSYQRKTLRQSSNKIV